MSSDEADSWMKVPHSADTTPWINEDNESEYTRSQMEYDTPTSDSVAFVPSVASGSMQHLRDLNKRLRSIYDEEGQKYAGNAKTDDELVGRFQEAFKMKQKRIDKIFNGIELTRNVDLLFLIDITGSMQRHFNAVKESVFKIVDLLLEGNDEMDNLLKLRLSLVGYRDFGDEVKFETLKFTESAQEFRDFCSKIVCTGGGDAAEDVFGGLEKTLELDWDHENAGTKLIFHIADSPCHGRIYHNVSLTDNYQEGDPNGRTPASLFAGFHEHDIFYHFGKINMTTDLMIKLFEEANKDPISTFNITDVQDELFCAVRESVWASSKRASASTTNGKGEKLREIEYVFAKGEPDWEEIEPVAGSFLSYAPPCNIDDIVEDVPLKRNKPEVARVLIAEHPFARGVERVAFYGRDKSASLSFLSSIYTSRPCDVVFKEYRHHYAGKMNLRFEISNQVQTIAAYLANRFCEDLRRKTGRRMVIEFLKTKTLAIQDKEGKTRYMSCEKRFTAVDTFIRFSNNVNYSILESKAKVHGIPMEYVDLLMAFSHWTYQITDEMLMVVDLQGIVHQELDKCKVMLTDPAIHCIDTTRYGQMNLGREGMSNFFRRHKCNDFCKGLELMDESTQA